MCTVASGFSRDLCICVACRFHGATDAPITAKRCELPSLLSSDRRVCRMSVCRAVRYAHRLVPPVSLPLPRSPRYASCACRIPSTFARSFFGLGSPVRVAAVAAENSSFLDRWRPLTDASDRHRLAATKEQLGAWTPGGCGREETAVEPRHSGLSTCDRTAKPTLTHSARSFCDQLLAPVLSFHLRQECKRLLWSICPRPDLS